MAAYGATSIFKMKEEGSMRSVFLEAIAQKLYEQQGVHSSIFHPLSFHEPEKSFFARLLDESDQNRFLNWLTCTNMETYFNTALEQKMLFPTGITLSDFKEFLLCPNILEIIDYILKDNMRSLTATYAATEVLFTTIEQKKIWATDCIQSFCHSFKLDSNTFMHYEKLSHLPLTKLKSEASSASDLETLFFISRPHHEKLAALTEDQENKFKACKIVLQDMRLKKSKKSDVDLAITEFCYENKILIEHLKAHALQSPKMMPRSGEEEVSAELGPLNKGVQWVKESFGLDAEIKFYDSAMKAVEMLRFIQKYESMVIDLMKAFSLGYRQATETITICGYGLIEPYHITMTHEQYQKFVTKEENSFSQIRHEVYYRVAEKEMAALQPDPSLAPLMQLKEYMKYIVSIIELASYDSNLFNGKKIQYSFNEKPQEKYIPPLLYQYRIHLKVLIAEDCSSQNSNSYSVNFSLRMQRVQSELTDDSVHSQWHRQFLASLLDKNLQHEEAIHSAGNDHSSLSSNPSPFQSEDQRRSRSPGQSQNLDPPAIPSFTFRQ